MIEKIYVKIVKKFQYCISVIKMGECFKNNMIVRLYNSFIVFLYNIIPDNTSTDVFFVEKYVTVIPSGNGNNCPRKSSSLKSVRRLI